MIKNYTTYKKTYFTLAFFIITFFGYSQTTTTFTSNSTWVCPAGVTSITIEAWGGGGNGGGANGDLHAGGGGAGGAYVKNNSLSVTPGASYNIIVGSEIIGDYGFGRNGISSSFALTATPAVLLINAVGGNGGIPATNTNPYANGGASVTTGNIGGTTSDIYGLPGTAGTAAKAGDGGNSGGGALGGIGLDTQFTNPGSLYGGGGSGGYTTANGPSRIGGTGAGGKVVITWSYLDFKGTTNNDYVDFGNNNSLTSNFSLEAWVLQNATVTNGTIISKGDAKASNLRGYHLFLNSGYPNLSWYNNSGGEILNIASPYAITNGANAKWHHIAATYDGANAKLYIDGVIVANKSTATPPTTGTEKFLMGTMYTSVSGPSDTANNFDGYIDEVRIWDVALTAQQIHEMMNQEIQINAVTGKVIGKTIPIDITGGLTWINLKAYYPMNDNTVNDKSNNGTKNGLSKNMTTVQSQTAPLPYKSALDGAWDNPGTWLNGTVQNLPISTGIDNSTKIEWSIIQIAHTITSGAKDITVLGLISTAGKLTIDGTTNISTGTGIGQSLRVTNYLKLDGVIDLAGESQLLQDTGSILDQVSAGYIERDQYGQANKYNYNYWGSPVGAINTTTNNNNFTVAGVLRDGTNPASPATITWIAGYDGTTTPFSLARYWIYKFDNKANAYVNWTQIGETGSLEAGKGFTLKGAGTSGTENLTFTGKPNNGTITNAIGANQLLLVGNPYPSALDADLFITDNIGSINTSVTDPAIDGALYFWEQFATNTTHILGSYQGGYGIRNLSGGLAPSATGVDFISGTGATSKLAPKQYIPVGQGFFVIGKTVTGGNVTFKNSQRAFVKEDNAASQTMYKSPPKPKGLNQLTNNSDDPIKKDTHKRIRLGYTIYNQSFHRQVLLAFMDEKANSEMNNGYDAFNIDDFPSDMYLLNGENELAIEGEGFFDTSASYPIGVKTDVEGKVSFMIDALENFDSEQAIFIYDNVTDTYHNLKNGVFKIVLPIGVYDTRFSLRFKDKTLKIEKNSINDIQISFNQKGNILAINNKLLDVTVEKVTLFNILGQSISSLNIENQEQQNIQVPIKNISSGIYIAKLKTSKGELSKKIIVH